MAEGLGIASSVAPLALARALPLALLVPLTGRFVPALVSLSLVVSLTAPTLFGEHVESAAAGASLVALLRELCLGLTFALASAVPILAAASSGRLLDHWLRPAARASTPYGALFELVALLSFFELGGHRAWFKAYARTMAELPLGELGLSRGAFLEGVLTIGANAIALSLSLVLPLLVSLWLCELGLALVQRAVSGAAVSLVELSRTAIVALLVLATAPVLIDALPDALRSALDSAQALIARAFA